MSLIKIEIEGTQFEFDVDENIAADISDMLQGHYHDEDLEYRDDSLSEVCKKLGLDYDEVLKRLKGAVSEKHLRAITKK